MPRSFRKATPGVGARPNSYGSRRFGTVRFDHGPPIAKVDTRPMVFVAFFLAVMMLVAASQVKTHVLMIDLPGTQQNHPIPQIRGSRYTVRMSSDTWVEFNGHIMSDDQLRETLLNLPPSLAMDSVVFAPSSDVSYGRAFQVLGILAEAGLTSGPFCFGDAANYRHFGIEQHRRWGGSDTSLDIAVSIYSDPEIRYVPPEDRTFDSCEPRSQLHREY